MKIQIVIEIDEEDNVTMETHGIKGPKCVDEIKRVTKNLAPIESTQKTKEYYEEDKSKLKAKKKTSIFSK